jgi:hypothetical protein
VLEFECDEFDIPGAQAIHNLSRSMGRYIDIGEKHMVSSRILPDTGPEADEGASPVDKLKLFAGRMASRGRELCFLFLLIQHNPRRNRSSGGCQHIYSDPSLFDRFN